MTEIRQFHSFIIITMILIATHDSAIRWEEVSRRRCGCVLEGFDLFNAEVSDIDYFYTSRLPGQPAGGVDDVHLHPAIAAVGPFRPPALFLTACTAGHQEDS